MYPQIHPSSTIDVSHSAVFIDFENLFYFLKLRLTSEPDALPASVDTLAALVTYIKEQTRFEPIIRLAYGDFTRLSQNDEEVMPALYHQGVETFNIVGTDHKNAADMGLCIDAISTLYTRPDVSRFFIVAGDRDYIPLIRHLRKMGRQVYVVSFKESMSGDLLRIVSNDFFVNAHELLPKNYVVGPEIRERTSKHSSEDRIIAEQPKLIEPPPLEPVPDFLPSIVISDQYLEVALEELLRKFGTKSEVWVSPYLNSLRALMPELTDQERREIINDLKLNGIVKVFKKRGDPYDYSVMEINWNHPDVLRLNPG
ncbi:MAG: NYN domain-containing protein [Fimbriimonadaceae bacterium]|nr:NYN domain-containing protein [Fimbriimonadaceae bacterium]